MIVVYQALTTRWTKSHRSLFIINSKDFDEIGVMVNGHNVSIGEPDDYKWFGNFKLELII